LKSLQKVVEVGVEQEIQVFVCGEMAAHPVFSAVLVGLGFQNLSMNAIAIPQVKKILSCFKFAELQDLAYRLISAPTLADIESLVESTFGNECNFTSGMNPKCMLH
jgi:phosphotransferase system enzyme I (PtsI)